MTRHAQVHLGLTFSCDQCPKQFNMKEKLIRHFRGSHGGVTGHFVVISIFNGLENVHAIRKNVMTAKKSKKRNWLMLFQNKSILFKF